MQVSGQVGGSEETGTTGNGGRRSLVLHTHSTRGQRRGWNRTVERGFFSRLQSCSDLTQRTSLVPKTVKLIGQPFIPAFGKVHAPVQLPTALYICSTLVQCSVKVFAIMFKVNLFKTGIARF